MKRSDITTQMVLEASIQYQREHKKFISEILMERTGAPEKVVYAAMDRDDRNGYLDFGVSLRTAWPTEKGMEYLNRIR